MKNREEQNEIELMQIKKLEQALYTMDFSEASNKKRVEDKVFGEIRERSKMSKKLNIRKLGVVLAAAVAACGVIQAVGAQGFVEKVIQTIKTDHIEATQYEKNDWKTLPVPESLKGKIYLKDGTEVKEFTPDMTEFYTADGEKIAHMDLAKGEIKTQKQEEQEAEKTTLVEHDINKINDYICFKAQLPTYLPEGYAFSRAEYYKEENETTVKDSKYIDIYFVNQVTGKELALQERFACEETAYEIGTDGKMEEVDINGAKAILSADKELDWEADGLLFSYHAKKNISSEELIKSAKSFK